MTHAQLIKRLRQLIDKQRAQARHADPCCPAIKPDVAFVCFACCCVHCVSPLRSSIRSIKALAALS